MTSPILTILELSLKNNKSDSYIPRGQKETTTGQDIVELTNRLRRLPEVEAVSISVNARPYIGSNSGIRFRLDTLVRSPLRRPVTPEFFRCSVIKVRMDRDISL